MQTCGDGGGIRLKLFQVRGTVTTTFILQTIVIIVNVTIYNNLWLNIYRITKQFLIDLKVSVVL